MNNYAALRETCKKKVRYATKALAEVAAKKSERFSKYSIRVYPCHWCGEWHLTSTSPWHFYDDECGKRFGKFTVMYRLTTHPLRYSCWCECGERELRTRKAINNPKNNQDACAKCRDDEFKQRKAVPHDADT